MQELHSYFSISALVFLFLKNIRVSLTEGDKCQNYLKN